MSIAKMQAGKNIPNDLNVVIEIPARSDPIKYELDKETGLLFVDRILKAPVFYPCAYGFVPNTIADDGDPLDVLVICNHSLIHGCVINVRPVGVLNMEDEAGKDSKIIAVPDTKVSNAFDKINDIGDVPEYLKDEIKFFFERYKDLDKNKWTKVQEFGTAEDAKKIILSSIKE